MRAIRRILVAVKDPAAKSLPAVAKAAQLAQALGAQLLLFQAVPPPPWIEGEITLLSSGLADLERTAREACLERLEVIARRVRRGGIKVVVDAAWDSPIHDAIIRAAMRANADLIVAAQHARGHAAAGLLHLTDWELLRLSPLPVLLVKRPGAYRRPVVLAALDPDHSYAKPARLDQEILRVGSAVAAALHGALHAVHAFVPVPAAAFPYGTLPPGALLRIQARAEQLAGRKLQRAVRALRMPGTRRHVIGRHAADAISQVAAQTRSAIVVMGAIARSGLKRLLIGNTAEKVLDRLRCDILVVKPAGFSKRPPRSHRTVRYLGVPRAPVMY
jgi:universal stress protein E